MTNVSASIKSGGASLGITAEPTRAGVDASQPTLEAVPGQHKTPPRKKQASRQRRWVLRFFGVTVGALLLVAACGGDGTNPSAGSPSRGPSAARGDFADTVDIGTGRKIYMECHGSGRPTVVLISGYGDRGDIWRLLSSDKPGPAVYAGVGKFTRACAYDRPGTHAGVGHCAARRSTPLPQPV